MVSSFRVIDHRDPAWSALYAARGRENGAATYSRELVRHHVPVWREWAAGRAVTVSTCPVLDGQDVKGEIAVQYLHSYPYRDPLHHAHRAATWLTPRFDRIVFVVAYRALADALRRDGHEALYVPMSVDTAAVRAAVTGVRPSRTSVRRAAYFGNVTRPKRAMHDDLRSRFAAHGWQLVRIFGSQEQCWRELTRFRFAVAVGRCALEAGALGLRVMIAGAEFGGVMMSEADRDAQVACNLNGRIVTYDRDVATCLAAWGDAIPGVTRSVEDGIADLRAGIAGLG